MAGRSSQGEEAYKLYMRITCLEMEKARRGKERDAAMSRVNQIDARIEDIEIEKAQLQKRTQQYDSKASARRMTGRDSVTPDSERKAFKHRY